jgi:hypothetical protein
MYRVHSAHPVLRLAAAALLAAGSGAVPAQLLSPNYTLTTPALLAEPEVFTFVPVATWGRLRLAAGGNASGQGLSFVSGENWFARAGIGRTLDSDLLSLGGGYRFDGGRALSVAVTRQFGQERLGLAVRYDLRQAYLRLSYEQPLRAPGAGDRLRFSAGMQF